jgi:prophage regulatory protein
MSSKILRFPEAVSRTGLSRATLYRLMKKGGFVRPIRIGDRAVGFRDVELDAWIESRQRA